MEINKSDTKTKTDKEINSLFLRKEIFDHAIIYTTNKIEESALLIYLKNLYEHFKNSKEGRKDGGTVHHDDQMYVTLDSWLSYNEIIKGQDHICSANFSHNVCKSLWILLSITLQSVRKKNNVKGQKTIFNAALEELHKKGGERHPKSEGGERHPKSEEGERHTKGEEGERHPKSEEGERHPKSEEGEWHPKSEEAISPNSSHTNGGSQVSKMGINMDSGVGDVAPPMKGSTTPQRDCGGEESGEKGDTPHGAWNENWLDEQVCIELVIFFIILQFLKIDNGKRKYDKNLSEDSWPHFGNSPRSLSSSSSGGGGGNGVGSSSVNASSSPSNCVSKSNLSDFFHFSGNNYNHFLKTYLIAFLCATDIVNSSTLTDTPLYFRSQHLFLLDFIIDTNDHTNVYERYLQKNEPKILYKTKEILTWLLTNLYMTDCESDEMVKDTSHSGNSLSSTTHPCGSIQTNGSHYGIENINNDIYEIKNIQGKTIYITSDKNIVNINNCKECNIFIFSNVEYLKIHLSLKIENVIDTNVYAYTETNIIIFGDTRNIQLAPYNVLNANQSECLRKSRISFGSKKCDLFAFPLKCKTSLFHSVGASHTALTHSASLAHTALTHTASLSGGASFPLSLKSSSGTLSRRADKSGKSAASSGAADIGLTANGAAGIGLTTNSATDIGLTTNGAADISLTTNGAADSGGSTANDGPCGKLFETSNLSSSFTDYVYYLLSPSKFFLTEFPSPNCSSEGGDRASGGGNHEEVCEYTSHLDDSHYDSDEKEPHPGEGTYNTGESQKYECLYLPEVYKNAIENQDDHILQFLSFMESIHLSGAQMQKVKKILTYKLYAYLKTSKKAFRVLTDLVAQEQDAPGGR
ncbi:hypothetical protein PCYB_131210 [Plasmodium cynomolgi strain B]|uniref:C-CAP/cofactor C-like domain-containing protein n=1 Tax=Plasmodium cynomolgi (strain B) TaxID=1120755 RepID=K6VG07_PLACD|nr:hypothetical protein PCYB_131210 [Plasmodium cynomolgi strain B]GAB68247.1 hypothetical protein PCYB_131210 [Plasmodium cynomolgi strain B]